MTELGEAVRARVEELIAQKRLRFTHAMMLRLMMTSLRQREIAKEMLVSPKTLKHYADAVYVKLGVFSRVEVVAIVLGTDAVFLKNNGARAS